MITFQDALFEQVLLIREAQHEALETACWAALEHGWVVHVHETGYEGPVTRFLGIELAEPEPGFPGPCIYYWQGGARWKK